MKDRRSLMEGLNDGNEVDRSVEEQFVFAGKAKPEQATHPAATAPAPDATRGGTGREPGGGPAGFIDLTRLPPWSVRKK
jgi:hypothetical protein